MKLKVEKRETGKKGITKRLRRERNIPVVLYGFKREPMGLAIERDAWEALLRGIPKGHLSTKVLELTGELSDVRVVVKEIQYHPTTYQVLHLDFAEVYDDHPVEVRVPLRFTGMAGCVGIKQGGVLRPVIRAIRVSAKPKDIPAELTLDVTDLGMQQSLRLKALALPEGVRSLAKLDEVAVVIAKR